MSAFTEAPPGISINAVAMQNTSFLAPAFSSYLDWIGLLPSLPDTHLGPPCAQRVEMPVLISQCSASAVLISGGNRG
jgi:hypothetical protein